MRRIVIAVLAAIAAATGLVAVQVTAPTSAGAVPPACLHIYRIYYNSPGTDTGTNASLNAEFVSLHNACTTTRVMTSWKLKDAQGHTFKFGAYSIRGGQYVRVHTGKGNPTATDRYWGQSWYIWNNDKDTASLYDNLGNLLARCSYNNPNASQKYC